MRNIILCLGISFVLAGCSQAPISLPSNVSTVPTGMGQTTYIDSIDHTFDVADTVTFDKVKFCAAEVFTNDGAILKDNAGSFLGAYSGRYYEKNNSMNIGGGNIFKYVDDKNSALVATGRTKTKAQQGGLVVDVVQYDATIKLSNNKVNFVFKNIKAAQENTGAVSNSGFRNVGTWAGARAPGVLGALDNVSDKFKACIN